MEFETRPTCTEHFGQCFSIVHSVVSFPRKLLTFLTFKLGVAPSQDSSDHQEYYNFNRESPTKPPFATFESCFWGPHPTFEAGSLCHAETKTTKLLDAKGRIPPMHPTGVLRWSSVTTVTNTKGRGGCRLDQWIQGALQLVRHSPHRTLGKSSQQKRKSGKCHSSYKYADEKRRKQLISVFWSVGCKALNNWIPHGHMVFSCCFLVFRCLFGPFFFQKQHPAKVSCLPWIPSKKASQPKNR